MENKVGAQEAQALASDPIFWNAGIDSAFGSNMSSDFSSVYEQCLNRRANLDGDSTRWPRSHRLAVSPFVRPSGRRGEAGSRLRIASTKLNREANYARANFLRAIFSAFGVERIMRKRPDQSARMIQRPSISLPSSLKVPS